MKRQQSTIKKKCPTQQVAEFHIQSETIILILLLCFCAGTKAHCSFRTNKKATLKPLHLLKDLYPFTFQEQRLDMMDIFPETTGRHNNRRAAKTCADRGTFGVGR